MNLLKIAFFTMLFFSWSDLSGNNSNKSYNEFKTNSFTSKAYKKALAPHVMPQNHPIKKSLDAIFTNQRVTSDLESFEAAGFKLLPTNQRSYVVVARHPDLPGYIIKACLDSEKNKKFGEPSWVWFVRRCELAKKIQSVIKSQKCYQFTVAKKWIYPLPTTPPPTNELYERKNEILVVTDMNLASDTENTEAWYHMSRTHLKQLYKIITYAGGSSYRKDNIPFTKSGKFAFIDTEYPYKTPSYETVIPSLSPEMRTYWMRLVKKGGLVHQ